MIRDGFVNNGSSALGGGGGSGSAMLKTMMNVASNAVGSAVLGGANPIGSGVNYLLKSDKLNLAAVIQASKSDSRAKYLASPIIMTVDNKEATIDATEARKFFNGYETSSSYSTYVRTPKYDSKDIGIKIKVKPKINPNGTVMLNVEEEYSQLGAGQAILVDDGGTANIDTSLTRKMTADVLLDDRQTVVLGGLTERYTSEKETGIPILKDIPWVGKWLFGSVTQTESRKELLVFMTPYVLDDAEAAQAEALRRKRSLSDSRAWESLGWSDSELADPVSKKELLRRLKEEAERQDEERQNRLAVEKWKMERAKALEKMSEAERKFWLEQHREELSEEEREAFDRQAAEQGDLKAFADSIREKGVKKAEEDIKKAESDEKKKADSTIEAPKAKASKVEEPTQPATKK
jgi:type II secretory pathway component GspD/PulD (secretin)